MGVTSFLETDWCDLDWSPWVPLDTPPHELAMTLSEPGVYRIKPLDKECLVYIGQTGRALRQRLRELREYRKSTELMPYNDPHTAAPSLWAWRDATGMDFACSAAPVSPDSGKDPALVKREREGLECYLLWQYRLEFRASTLCNFGRFHPNYLKSRDKNSKKRGGRLPDGAINPAGGASFPPLRLHGNPTDRDWMTLSWTDPRVFDDQKTANVPAKPGVYKILDAATGELCYIGQTKTMRSRLATHGQKSWEGREVAFAYCLQPGTVLPHQLKELENDLIAAFYAATKTVPRFQFLGH
ncbi:hypothetical protein ABH15_07465 [Methanoculleus taiwanensis]|uniref:GIY-YIG domain-containing protein n=2 Tax=Methanoculleus taiwanensis TaxID=1550565 RepID=A0A498H284_9EURY|nr:hypothetical protein ABH15_07465 [Methanoculleus taiwanensis]